MATAPGSDPSACKAFGLDQYRSTERASAGEILIVEATGCWLRGTDASRCFRRFPARWAASHRPVKGDWWMIFEDGFETFSPGWAFHRNYRFEA